MKWFLLVYSVAVVNPTHMQMDQSGPYKNREACMAAAQAAVDAQFNLKTSGKIRVTTRCVAEGRG